MFGKGTMSVNNTVDIFQLVLKTIQYNTIDLVIISCCNQSCSKQHPTSRSSNRLGSASDPQTLESDDKKQKVEI